MRKWEVLCELVPLRNQCKVMAMFPIALNEEKVRSCSIVTTATCRVSQEETSYKEHY